MAAANVLISPIPTSFSMVQRSTTALLITNENAPVVNTGIRLARSTISRSNGSYFPTIPGSTKLACILLTIIFRRTFARFFRTDAKISTIQLRYNGKRNAKRKSAPWGFTRVKMNFQGSNYFLADNIAREISILTVIQKLLTESIEKEANEQRRRSITPYGISGRF